MRVLFFSRSCTVHDVRFLRKLVESRHEIHFLTLEANRSIADGLPARVHATRIPVGEWARNTPDSWFRLAAEFEQIIEGIKPDLVHAGPIQSCGMIAALARFHPLMVMSWGSDMLLEADRDPQARWMTRFALQSADWFVCDCDAVEQKMHKFALIGHDRVVKFPWGIDLKQFQAGRSKLALREKLGWSADAVIVLSTRSWEPIYAIDVLLKAFHIALRQESRLRLVLLGGGSQEGHVKHLVKEYSLTSFIHMPGKVAHEWLPEYFRFADVYVACTFCDGSSISLLEALATGLPVVVTNAFGNREWVTPGTNGRLCESGNAQAFAEGVLWAASLTPQQRDIIRTQNRQLAEARADWDVNGQILLDAYDKIERLRAS